MVRQNLEDLAVQISVLPVQYDVIFIDGAMSGNLATDIRPLLNKALSNNPSAGIALQNQRCGLFFLEQWAHQEQRPVYIPRLMYGLKLEDFSAALILDDGSSISDDVIDWCTKGGKPVYKLPVECTPFEGDFINLPKYLGGPKKPSLLQRLKERFGAST